MVHVLRAGVQCLQQTIHDGVTQCNANAGGGWFARDHTVPIPVPVRCAERSPRLWAGCVSSDSARPCCPAHATALLSSSPLYRTPRGHTTPPPRPHIPTALLISSPSLCSNLPTSPSTVRYGVSQWKEAEWPRARHAQHPGAVYLVLLLLRCSPAVLLRLFRLPLLLLFPTRSAQHRSQAVEGQADLR